VNFIDHEESRPAAGGHFVAGLVEDFADILHSARDRAKLSESAVGLVSQQTRERCLTDAGRPVKNYRAEPPGLQHPP
jgi:hypothetical protein